MLRSASSASKWHHQAMKDEPTPFEAPDPGPFYHGSKAGLRLGELLEPGYSSTSVGGGMRTSSV